jgi:hypothetical protein
MFDCGIKQPNGKYGEKPVSPRGYEPRSYAALDNKYTGAFGLGGGVLRAVAPHTPKPVLRRRHEKPSPIEAAGV